MEDTKIERQKFQMHKKGYEDIASSVDKLADSLTETLSPKEIGDGAIFTVKGLKGDKGDKGEQGDKGDKGDKGDSIKGDKGDKGDKGADSKIAGPKGDKGDKGKDGKDGSNGIDGKDGKNGSPDSADEIVSKLQGVKKQWLSIEAIDGDFNKKVRQVLAVGASGSNGLPEAPIDGKQYARKDENWEEVVGGSGSGIVETVVAGTGISVNSTDPANPIVTNTNPTPYTLPTASDTVLGGVKVGTRLSIDGNGVLSADVQTGGGDVLWGGNTNGAKKLIGSNDDFDIGFETNNTERLTILKEGNVGIGNTNPVRSLDLTNINSNGTIRVDRGSYTGNREVTMEIGDQSGGKEGISGIRGNGRLDFYTKGYSTFYIQGDGGSTGSFGVYQQSNVVRFKVDNSPVANGSISLEADGTGGIRFVTNANTGSLKQAEVTHTASAVNYLSFTGAITTGNPTISVLGTDTNIGLNLQTKGSGNLIIPNGNVGIGTTAPTSKLHIAGSVTHAYVAKTANYTADATDYLINCTTNSFTVTLPTAVGITGRVYNIKNSGTGVITVATTSSQTIDGVTTQGVNSLDNLKVMSDGANYIII